MYIQNKQKGGFMTNVSMMNESDFAKSVVKKIKKQIQGKNSDRRITLLKNLRDNPNGSKHWISRNIQNWILSIAVETKKEVFICGSVDLVQKIFEELKKALYEQIEMLPM